MHLSNEEFEWCGQWQWRLLWSYLLYPCNSFILWLYVKIKLTSQSLQHWRQIGHKKPLSVLCYIGNWNWMLAKLYHCQKHTAALFLNFAKCNSDLIFHESVILSTTTTLQCWISVWEENWNGHKVHSPWRGCSSVLSCFRTWVHRFEWKSTDNSGFCRDEWLRRWRDDTLNCLCAQSRGPHSAWKQAVSLMSSCRNHPWTTWIWMNEFLMTYYKPGRPISRNVGS